MRSDANHSEAAPEASTGLQLRGISGGPGDGVLHGVDLDVEAGEFVVVLGASGAGKTTLLEMIAGLQRPSSGRIRIGEKVVFDGNTDVPPRERKIGIAFQDLGLLPRVNVLDHLSLCLENRRSTSSRNIDSMMVLERLGMRGRMTAYPAELSGGERRRLALGRALVVAPKVMLLDEPLSGVDGPFREELYEVVREIHRRAKSATLYVTHRWDEALALADSIAVLEDGRLQQTGPAHYTGSPPTAGYARKAQDDGETKTESADPRRKPRLQAGALYGGYDGRVLKGVDLEVAAGELMVVLGPSGCGKTTLLETIAGLQRSASGEIRIDGQVVASRDVHVPPNMREVGMAFQDLGLWPHVDVRGHISLCQEAVASESGASESGASESGAVARSHPASAGLRLRGKEASYPGQLSGGERRRLTLARALAASPKVMLLDEPLAGVDDELREQLYVAIRESHESSGAATILVTHRLEEALALGDSVAILAEGRIHQVGAVRGVYEAPLTATAARLMGFENAIPADTMGAFINRLVPLDRQRELGNRDEWAFAVRARGVRIEPGGIWQGSVTGSRLTEHGFLTRIAIGEFTLLAMSDTKLDVKTEVDVSVGDEFRVVENW